MKKTSLASAISSILAAGTLSTTVPVLAQDQGVDRISDDEAVEEVVVIGSRIRKDVFTSSAPMDVIDVATASIQGIANVGQLLQTNTVAAGSPQVMAAIHTEFVANGGLGAATISLRGLGANRTLVLLNGRRAGPSGVQGGTSAFDLNVLPLSAIERVEILKDGASSIYGSDAVAGVVNIITRKGDGGSIDAFTSIPVDGGGEESRINASWGKTFTRGNFRVTGDYNKVEDLPRGKRDYFTCGNQYIFDQTSGARADLVDPRTGELWCEDLTWGHVWVYDYPGSNIPNPFGQAGRLAQFDYDGDLGQFIPGYAVDPNNPSWMTQPGGFFPVGYDATSDPLQNDNHPFQDKNSIIPESETMTIYAEGEYQLTDNVTAYAEVLLNRRTTKFDDYQQYWSYLYSGDHSFAPDPTDPNCADPNDPLFDYCYYTMQQVGGSSLTAAAGWNGQVWFSPTAITDRGDSSVEVDYQRFVAGLRGSLTESWDWDLAFTYSKSEGEYTTERVFLDSVFDNNFAFGSCVGTVSSVRGVPCVDVPWFDPELLRGNVSPEVDAFLFGSSTGTTDYTQWSVEGFVTGEAYDLPAGPLSFAVGFHYREDEIVDTPESIVLDGNDWGGDAAGITAGDDATKAFFVEVDVPVLADRPGFENLTFNASARYTDVDSYGSDTTWKVGVNWQIVPSLRLRANQGTSFRTPALFELFLADQTSFIDQRDDPCRRYEAEFQVGNISQNTRDNCEADPRNLPPDYSGGTISPSVFTGGGLGVLEAETSDSTTIGFIWQPQFADLSLSVDFFDIEVKDEVDQLGGAQIVASCYESDFGFAFGNTEPLCQLFDRSQVNDGLNNIMDSFINIARQRNRGYDIAARYLVGLGPGDLTIDVSATYQLEDIKALFEETVEDLNGRVGDPEWVANSRITYDHGPWTYFWGVNFIGESSQVEAFGRTTITYRGVQYDAVLDTDAVFYHAFSLAYDFNNGVRLLGGIANAFDENPPQLTREGTTAEYFMVGNSLLASQYDFYGRRFYANLTYNFD